MGRVLRRAIGGLLVVLLIATGLAFYVYSPYLDLARPGASGADPGRPRTGATPAAGPTSTASPTPVPSPSADPTDPGGRQAGLRLVATVRSGQVFDVVETVRLPTAVRSVSLAPPDLTDAGGDLSSMQPYATRLVVRAAGKRVPSPGTVRRPVTVDLERPTERVEIRYRLHRAIRLNEPSAAGRAVGAVAPLVARLPADFPVAASFPGHGVRNLSCVRLPLDQETCFAGERPRVRVRQLLAYRDALVQVQLNLLAVGAGTR